MDMAMNTPGLIETEKHVSQSTPAVMALASGAFGADPNDIPSTSLALANPFQSNLIFILLLLSGPAIRRKEMGASSILLQRKLELKPTLTKCQEFLRKPLTPACWNRRV